MMRLFIAGIALLIAVGWSADLVHAQSLPKRKDCRAGMTYQECIDACVAVGGKGKKSPEMKCPNYCAKHGCK